MAFYFEQAGPEDIDEIMRIEDESFVPGIREERAVFQQRLAAFPGGNFVLMRNPEERRLAGYFFSEIWDTVPPPDSEKWNLGHSAVKSHSPEGSVLYVSSFAVEPSSRGNGKLLFTASIAQITARYPQLRNVAFIVHSSWQAARHIYENEGFACTGSINGFFPENGNALIMEKIL